MRPGVRPGAALLRTCRWRLQDRLLGSVEVIAAIAEVTSDYPEPGHPRPGACLRAAATSLPTRSGRGDDRPVLPQTTVRTPQQPGGRRLAQALNRCAGGRRTAGVRTHAGRGRLRVRAGDRNARRHAAGGEHLYGSHGADAQRPLGKAGGSYHGSGCNVASALAAAHVGSTASPLADAVPWRPGIHGRRPLAAFRPGMGGSSSRTGCSGCVLPATARSRHNEAEDFSPFLPSRRTTAAAAASPLVQAALDGGVPKSSSTATRRPAPLRRALGCGNVAHLPPRRRPADHQRRRLPLAVEIGADGAHLAATTGFGRRARRAGSGAHPSAFPATTNWPGRGGRAARCRLRRLRQHVPLAYTNRRPAPAPLAADQAEARRRLTCRSRRSAASRWRTRRS